MLKAEVRHNWDVLSKSLVEYAGQPNKSEPALNICDEIGAELKILTNLFFECHRAIVEGGQRKPMTLEEVRGYKKKLEGK